ncbi:pyridine nucleotide-disulfide oxidoreductase [Streptomyces fuscichromogenes]|uniref:Pyridine nucleotide-disulfide oxidoreductase n=1 Tax=Streptomyces fuscichromogenes TaxID=1324013 RepID=A0A918CT55_9ACTN|nr:pyridine nucleotide-disulfide oxidoreductase [Streptomyces fuscichromogenes]
MVGAGQGGLQVAASLREGGFAGPVTVVDTEPGLPYQRPPLSKAFLTDDGGRSRIELRSAAFFDEHGIGLRTGTGVVAIDRTAGKVALEQGEFLDYGHLVLATGATPRALPVPGADQAGVVVLRTLADATTLRGLLRGPARRVVIVGGGFIGLEVAAVAAKLGHQVTIVEVLPRLMARVASPELAAHVAEVHRDHGTEIVFGRCVVALRGAGGAVRAVELDDGTLLDADVVLVGIGAVPKTDLAVRAGLDVDNGVVVDGRLRTSDPAISAIGDCANYPSHHAGRRTRLESVQNAVDQARHVAARIITGSDEPYRAVPWFWTNQFDLRVQMVGIPQDQDERVVHGDQVTGRFSVFRFHDGRLNTVESVNRAPDHVGARKLLATDLRPTAEQVRRAAFKLDPRNFS